MRRARHMSAFISGWAAKVKPARQDSPALPPQFINHLII
jgi:hypothetical protein